MNNLLIFFAFPIAVIIFSIVLQKLLHSPLAVAALVFAVFIVITFSVFDENFLIATLAYTILAYVTALLVDRLWNNHNNFCNKNMDSTTCLCNALTDTLENNNNSTNNVIDGLLDLLHNNNGNDDENNADEDNNSCTYNSSTKNTKGIPSDDNVINNNCGYMYNRRCRRF